MTCSVACFPNSSLSKAVRAGNSWQKKSLLAQQLEECLWSLWSSSPRPWDLCFYTKIPKPTYAIKVSSERMCGKLLLETTLLFINHKNESQSFQKKIWNDTWCGEKVIYLQSRSRDTDVKKKCMIPRREREGRMNWEIGTDMYIRLHIR